jgi:hypothetical protein
MMDVEIDGTTYPAHADVATASAYLAADVNAQPWRDAEEIDQARALVTATRILDRQPWREGYATDAAWLAMIPDATAELAAQIIGGYDASNQQTTAQSIRRQKAGSVEIEYFRGAEGQPLRLPLPVWELIRPFLAGGGVGLAGSIAHGVDGRSITERPCGYDLSGWVGHSFGDCGID